jgi:hypothetical protein
MEALYCFWSSAERMSPNLGGAAGGAGADGGAGGGAGVEEAAAGGGEAIGRTGFFAAGAGLFT